LKEAELGLSNIEPCKSSILLAEPAIFNLAIESQLIFGIPAIISLNSSLLSKPSRLIQVSMLVPPQLELMIPIGIFNFS